MQNEQQDSLPLPSETQAESPAEPQDINQPEIMPSLEDMLKQAELLAQEHHDAWLRAKADAENIRKRAQEDIAKAHKFAVDGFSSEMLAVKDSLEAALANRDTTIDTIVSGVELTLKQLASVFEKFNIAEIYPVGEKFDPHRHQAMSMVEADAEPNTVVMVLQKGYLLNDRVLRPALVTVAKTKGA